MGIILKLYAIVSLFTPLLCYSAHLVAAHGHQVNVLRLALMEQSIILALLLLPIFALRHFHIVAPRQVDAHASEPHLME